MASTSTFLRRTDLTDAPGIARLVSARSEEVFGNVNLVATIEKSILSITAVDPEGKIVGFVSFSDDPGLPGIDPANWETQLKFDAGLGDIGPHNALFVSYLIIEAGAAADLPAQLLRTLFSAVPDVHACFLFSKAAVVPSDLQVADLFHPATIDTPTGPATCVLACPKSAVVSGMRVRSARAEDYDDLMPIFSKQSDMLIARFGEFFLADLIEAQSELNLALVAEVDGKPVGFVATSTKVDLGLLQRGFALGALNNLQSLHRREVPVVKKQPAPTSVTFTEEGHDANSKRGSKAAVGKAKRLSVLAPHGSQTHIALEPVDEEPQMEIVEEWLDSTFCITLFCMDELYETQGVTLLAGAFELMKGRDFCLLTLPHASAEIPLLTNFMRAVPVSRAVVSQQLYVLHRASLSPVVAVRTVTAADVPAIETLASRSNTALIADVHQFLSAGSDADGTRLFAHVVTIAEQVVGACILRSARDICTQLRSHYNIEEFILFSHYMPGEHAVLHHFLFNPIFERFAKFALREVMRKAKVSCVYYRHLSEPTTAYAPSSPSTITEQMVPVRRRRQIVYPLDRLDVNAPSAQLRDLDPPFALAFIARKLMLEPKIVVNTRIVVVGASDAGLALLESLVYKPHLHFTNLTLVSRHGLPSGDDLGPLSSSLAYSSRDCKQTALPNWVNIVSGVTTTIRRDKKQIELEDGAIVPYDYLALTPGLQYGAPAPDIVLPSQAFTVNDKTDASALLDWLGQGHLHSDEPAIVIYGDSLDTLALVNAVLARNIANLHIILVQPKACDLPEEVASDLKARLLSLGVTTMHQCSFARINVLEDDSLGSVEFVTADGDTEIVDCDAFVNACSRNVHPATFAAVNESFLVFDGRIVTDSKFCTNDPSIYAAGSAAKFSRKYFADQSPPELYNSKEVGASLAQSLLLLVDPLSAPAAPAAADAAAPQDPASELPVLAEAKVIAAVLPRDLVFVSVGKPCPRDASSSKLKRLLTKDVDGDGRLTKWFEIAIDEFGIIDSVTFLSATPVIDTSNLVSLFGLHEKVLNRLVARHAEGLIPDFFSFFRDSWAVAIFHDRFRSFMSGLFTQVKDSVTINTLALDESIAQLAKLTLAEENTDPAAESELRASCRAIANSEGASRLVKDRLMDFLTYNAYLLPNYARPGMW